MTHNRKPVGAGHKKRLNWRGSPKEGKSSPLSPYAGKKKGRLKNQNPPERYRQKAGKGSMTVAILTGRLEGPTE